MRELSSSRRRRAGLEFLEERKGGRDGERDGGREGGRGRTGG